PPSGLRRLLRTAGRHPLATTAIFALLALVLGSLLFLYLTDPERPLREMNRELARGETVRLLSGDGRPRWFQWRAGKTDFLQRRPGAGILGLQSLDICGLELLPEVKQPWYEFDAWIRHELSEFGETGLFFGLRELPSPQGPVLFFFSVSFNDL